jgi:flagellin
MIIQNNNLAAKAFVPYQNNISSLGRSAARLSTGKKYASAIDGSGDLGVSHRMRLNYRGSKTMLAGMQNARSLAQSQDEIMQQVEDIITRMQELATSAVDPTKTAADRAALNNEFRVLSSEVASVAANTNYNGGLMFQTARTIRLGVASGETMTQSAINLSNLSFTTLSVNNVTAASAAIAGLATRAGSLSVLRSRARGHAARLERTLSFTQDYISNLTNAESAIRDADVAQESGEFTRAQVVVAASQAVLAQANGITQGALSFLQF